MFEFLLWFVVGAIGGVFGALGYDLVKRRKPIANPYVGGSPIAASKYRWPEEWRDHVHADALPPDVEQHEHTRPPGWHP